MTPTRTTPVPAVSTPEQVVQARAAELRTFTRTGQFTQVAAEHDFTDPVLFDRFRTALDELIGVDYVALQQIEVTRRTTDQWLVEQASRGPRLMLFAAGTRTTFTICRADGRLVWHDHFSPEAAIGNDADATELAAGQAIWLAGRARACWGADAATLYLILARSHGVDLTRLNRHAVAVSLVLDVVTDPVEHPANLQRSHPGTVDWSSTDPAKLLHPRQAGA
ncbi:Uncharacterised protein [Nocardia farcinica]|uniref:hypothetical protein n=1 Tax=Nocardia farcinica TaxID=37329 RepID=UPI000E002D44|nr:hypothetical protein [Nocardia farcinica]SUE28926.1 Uncharacterised protein [Nocardia farcinica]